MNKKGNVAIITAIMVTVIVGAILTSIVFTQINDQTTTTAVTNDTFLAANNTCTRVTTRCITDSSGTLLNATNGDDVTTYFEECGSGNNDNYGYRLLAAGGLESEDGAYINASYSEESCARITGGLTTTIVGYFAVLMAVVLLAFIAAYIR